MRGALAQRGKTWSVVISTRGIDGKWKQRWISTGLKSKKYAEKALNEILHKVNKSNHIAHSRQALED